MNCFGRASIGVLVVLALGICPAHLLAAEPVRIGVYGLDNYQAVAFAELLNSPKASGDLAGVRIVAAFPDSPSADIPESVANQPKWEMQIQQFGVVLVPTLEELLKQVDGVMIMSVDGRKHLAQATQVLQAGKRLYIGRPLAHSLADAAQILRLAEEAKVPCWSSSQHRYSPGFSGMRQHPEVGKVLGCDVYGGFETEPHHGEFIWHGVHSVETLYTIMGPGCVSVACTSTPSAEVVTGIWADGRIGTYRAIRQGKPKYSATVFGDKGVSTAGIYGHGVPVQGVVPTNDEYMGYKGIAIELAKFYRGGPPPVAPAETIEIFQFMEAAARSKQQNGVRIPLSAVAPKP